MAGEVPELPVLRRELCRFERGKAEVVGGKGRLLGIEKDRSDVGVESSITAVLLETWMGVTFADAGAAKIVAVVDDC